MASKRNRGGQKQGQSNPRNVEKQRMNPTGADRSANDQFAGQGQAGQQTTRTAPQQNRMSKGPQADEPRRGMGNPGEDDVGENR